MLSQHLVLGDKTTRRSISRQLEIDHTPSGPFTGRTRLLAAKDRCFSVGCISLHFFFFFFFFKASGSIATNSSNKFLSQLLTTLRWENAPLDNSGSHQVPLLSAALVPGFSRPI